MTLRQQFSLLASLLVVVLLAGNLMVTVMNGRDYFEQQLNGRAYDAATSLALSMSQIDTSDSVQQTRLMDVLFDRGFFEDITFTRVDGETLHRRAREAIDRGAAPEWFRSLVSLELVPAEADVTRGWQRLGTVTVISHADFAYRDLWSMIRAEMIWFAWVLLIALVALQLLLRLLFRSLVRVEKQALAISERDLQIQEKIPRARELRRVVEAMNKMVRKLQAIFAEQAEMTERLREESYLDIATGLLNRRGFDQQFGHILSRDEEHSGVLMIMQIQNFAEFNLNAGRQAGDDLLAALGKALEQWRMDYPHSLLGRRAGADFSIYVPCVDRMQAEEIIQQAFSLLSVSALSQRNELSFHLGGVYLQGNQDDPVDAFSRADAALRQAQRQTAARYQLYQRGSSETAEWTAGEWHSLLHSVLDSQSIQLEFLPVISNKNQRLLQIEVFSRVRWQGQTLSAARFWPMVEQHRLASRFDLVVIEKVLSGMADLPLESDDVRLCINLSPASVLDENFHHDLVLLLERYPTEARRIALEVPEFALYSAEHAIARLALRLQVCGVEVGIDQVGTGSMAFAYLQRLPLAYVRIDGSFNRGVHQAQDHRFYIQSMVQIAHNLDLLVLAEGLEDEPDVQAVRQTGVDGLGGYYFTRPMSDMVQAVQWQPAV
ncbi:MAG: EAL domain-containing protein [Thalassolituus sp.]